VLYVSYDNVGVKAFDGRGWHDVTDFYTPATTEGGRSGLTYMVNPGQPTDLLLDGGRQATGKTCPTQHSHRLLYPDLPGKPEQVHVVCKFYSGF
jgi:hypothetical protein